MSNMLPMTMMTISRLNLAQQVSDTFCEPVPELSQKLQLKHHQFVRLLEGRVRTCKCSKKMISPCCQRSSEFER